MRNLLFLTFVTLLFPFATMAQEPHIDSPAAKELYLSGIKAFQTKKWEEAKELFRLAYTKEPANKFILFNWGRTEYELGHFGMAAGVWRKALSLDPDFRSAQQALEILTPKLKSQHGSVESGFYESLRNSVLIYTTGDKLLFLIALLLLSSGLLMIRYLGKRRHALENETPLPPFPAVATLLSCLFCFALFVGAGKLYDFFQPRATVVQPSASVYTGPSEDSPSLFELYEGFEVILNRSQGTWLQITSPGGLSGWVKQDSVFQTSGRELW